MSNWIERKFREAQEKRYIENLKRQMDLAMERRETAGRRKNSDWEERMDREAREATAKQREATAKQEAELALVQADLARIQREAKDREERSKTEGEKYLGEKRGELERIAQELRIKSILLQVKDVWIYGQTSESFNKYLPKFFERGVSEGEADLEFNLKDSHSRDFYIPAYRGGRDVWYEMTTYSPSIAAHTIRVDFGSWFQIRLFVDSRSEKHFVDIGDGCPTSEAAFPARRISIDGLSNTQAHEKIEESAYEATKARKDRDLLPTDVRRRVAGLTSLPNENRVSQNYRGFSLFL